MPHEPSFPKGGIADTIHTKLSHKMASLNPFKQKPINTDKPTDTVNQPIASSSSATTNSPQTYPNSGLQSHSASVPKSQGASLNLHFQERMGAYAPANNSTTPSDPNDIFQRISNNPPPSQISTTPTHPVPLDWIRTRTTPVSDTNLSPLGGLPTYPLQTNKFYSNLFLGSQECQTWSQPYSIWWSKGRGNVKNWGMSVTHTERDGLAFGEQNQFAARYFFGPIGVQQMVLSAAELGSSTALYVDSLDTFSANANLSITKDQAPIISLPLVQGMGLVTSIYRGCTPQVQSSVFFRDFVNMGTINAGSTEKYKVTLEDGFQWIIYRTYDDSVNQNRSPLNKISNSTIQGENGFRGYIQIAKIPSGLPDSVYDQSAGTFVISGQVIASRDGPLIRYQFKWNKAGLDKPAFMFALPHHLESFDPAMNFYKSPAELWTITKGKATGFIADQWNMTERTYPDLDFAPYDLTRGSVGTMSPDAQAQVIWAGGRETEQDVQAQCCLDSMYFSGKGFGKFAMMAIALDMINRPDLANKILPKLKAAMAVFTNNKQINPLVYEKSWKGVVSSAGMSGNAGADFGNSFYNDHHFHYGYFVYSAAVIGRFDPAWLQVEQNREWINMLIRDYANTAADDYFPFSRSFDWFNGHGWAKGLFESADGKDQESSSEDAFSSYALKMWGKVASLPQVEANGDLRLSMQKRAFDAYFLYASDNTTQPSRFIGNKVSGILFENKIDHATYFGSNIEYIQGIHAVPASSISSIMRSTRFASEEWNQYFSNGRADKIEGGWRGIIHASQAQFDPLAAFQWFAQRDFDYVWLDGGASRTWYLAYTAALAGA